VYVVSSFPDLIILLTRPTQLLPDDFARNGFKVYVPELFEGDAVSEDAFNPVRHSRSTTFSLINSVLQGSSFDLKKWIPNHTAEHTGKRVRKVIDGLKEQGVTIYGATGYCYGGTIPIRDYAAQR
jgi:dienelactone hydrolase